MNGVIRMVLGTAVVLVITALIGYFADSPRHRYADAEMAQIKLSLMHTGARSKPCVRRTREELDAIPHNMRRPVECVRDRVPVAVRIMVDGETVYDEALYPTGLFSDGPARAYVKMAIPAGVHEIAVGIRDTARDEGFDYERTEMFDLAPRRNLVIDFAPGEGGIIFR